MKLAPKSGKDVIETLKRLGFVVVRKRKHYILKRGKTIVSVPFHKKIPKGTIRAIIREAGITLREFLENDP